MLIGYNQEHMEQILKVRMLEHEAVNSTWIQKSNESHFHLLHLIRLFYHSSCTEAFSLLTHVTHFYLQGVIIIKSINIRKNKYIPLGQCSLYCMRWYRSFHWFHLDVRQEGRRDELWTLNQRIKPSARVVQQMLRPEKIKCKRRMKSMMTSQNMRYSYYIFHEKIPEDASKPIRVKFNLL